MNIFGKSLTKASMCPTVGQHGLSAA